MLVLLLFAEKQSPLKIAIGEFGEITVSRSTACLPATIYFYWFLSSTFSYRTAETWSLTQWFHYSSYIHNHTHICILMVHRLFRPPRMRIMLVVALGRRFRQYFLAILATQSAQLTMTTTNQHMYSVRPLISRQWKFEQTRQDNW